MDATIDSSLDVPSLPMSRRSSSSTHSGNSSSRSSSPENCRGSIPSTEAPTQFIDPCPSNVIFTPSVHTLRSNRQYSNQEIYRRQHQSLLNAFWNVYRPFSKGNAIPDDARERLDSFRVSGDEFAHMVIDKELEYSRFIYLEDNRIIFDELRDPPHGEIINEVSIQIGMQDRAGGDLFSGGTGNRMSLFTLLLIKI